ncbi:DUF4167 domain-containing protein [Plastoroseomonas hellenica]|uniref:DUF4167 domain-containing protein n=1 Tax=Plastoroseomonas hellenica TaxID=2687306 RepID=UPI0038D0B6CB
MSETANATAMNMKRMRGRGGQQHRHGGGGGNFRHTGGGGGGGNGNQPMNRNHVFDSSGPDMRLRGTAQQLFEKYLQLGRDATGGGDRVMAESYFQHAEHYFRILNAMNQAQQPPPQQPQGRRYQNQPDGGDQPEGGEQPEMNGHANGHAADAEDDAETATGESREPV